MTSATEFENVGNQPPYSRINARWDAPDDELDNDNSSARLFERSRIKALAGTVWGHKGWRAFSQSQGSQPSPPSVNPLCVLGEPWHGSDGDMFAGLREVGVPLGGSSGSLCPQGL